MRRVWHIFKKERGFWTPVRVFVFYFFIFLERFVAMMFILFLTKKLSMLTGGGQRDQIGRFWMFLAKKFLSKSIQNIWWHFGQFLNTALLKNNHWCLWCQLLEKLGYCLFQNLVTLPATVTWWCSFAQAIYPIKFEKLCNFTTKII